MKINFTPRVVFRDYLYVNSFLPFGRSKGPALPSQRLPFVMRSRVVLQLIVLRITRSDGREYAMTHTFFFVRLFVHAHARTTVSPLSSDISRSLLQTFSCHATRNERAHVQVSKAFLFVSGEDAAKQQGLVGSKGITHIINCAGPQCPNYIEYVRRTVVWALGRQKKLSRRCETVFC